MSMSLEATEAECAANATAPRVSLSAIEAAISQRHDLTAAQAVAGFAPTLPPDSPLRLLSICLLVLQNGFVVIGKSAPASAENFNADLGKKLAYEDAIRQIWPLMGFALRENLAAAAEVPPLARS